MAVGLSSLLKRCRTPLKYKNHIIIALAVMLILPMLISCGGGGGGGGGSQATVVPNTPTIQFDRPTYAVTNSNRVTVTLERSNDMAAQTFTVNRDTDPEAEITSISPSLSDGDNMIDFVVNQTSQDFIITAAADDGDGDGTMTLKIETAPDGYQIGSNNQVSVSVTPPPEIYFADAAISIIEDSSVGVHVHLTSAQTTGNPVYMLVGSLGGTAQKDVDYTVSDGWPTRSAIEYRFRNGSTRSDLVTLRTNADSVTETTPETVVFTLANPLTGYVVDPTRNRLTVSIIDFIATAKFTSNTYTVTEGNPNPVDVGVEFTNPIPNGSTATYGLVVSGAVLGTEYSLSSNVNAAGDRITFTGDGSTTQFNITVTSLANSISEDKTIRFVLYDSPEGYGVGTPFIATITIQNQP